MCSSGRGGTGYEGRKREEEEEEDDRLGLGLGDDIKDFVKYTKICKNRLKPKSRFLHRCIICFALVNSTWNILSSKK